MSYRGWCEPPYFLTAYGHGGGVAGKPEGRQGRPGDLEGPVQHRGGAAAGPPHRGAGGLLPGGDPCVLVGQRRKRLDGRRELAGANRSQWTRGHDRPHRSRGSHRSCQYRAGADGPHRSHRSHGSHRSGQHRAWAHRSHRRPGPYRADRGRQHSARSHGTYGSDGAHGAHGSRGSGQHSTRAHRPPGRDRPHGSEGRCR